jgi:hypothetical protein
MWDTASWVWHLCVSYAQVTGKCQVPLSNVNKQVRTHSRTLRIPAGGGALLALGRALRGASRVCLGLPSRSPPTGPKAKG